MTTRSRTREVRVADLVRLGLGLLTLLAPRAVLRATGADDRPAPRILSRVLGARLLAQSAAGLAAPRRRVLLADCVVELSHGASTVGLAAMFPSYRRLSVLSGTVATVLAAADIAALRDEQIGDRG